MITLATGDIIRPLTPLVLGKPRSCFYCGNTMNAGEVVAQVKFSGELMPVAEHMECFGIMVGDAGPEA